MNVLTALTKAMTALTGVPSNGASPVEVPFEVDTGPPVPWAPATPLGEPGVQKEVVAIEPKPQAEILDLLDAILALGQDTVSGDSAERPSLNASPQAQFGVRIGALKAKVELEDIAALLSGIGIQAPVQLRPEDLHGLRVEIAEQIVKRDLPSNLKGLLYGLLSHRAIGTAPGDLMMNIGEATSPVPTESLPSIDVTREEPLSQKERMIGPPQFIAPNTTTSDPRPLAPLIESTSDPMRHVVPIADAKGGGERRDLTSNVHSSIESSDQMGSVRQSPASVALIDSESIIVPRLGATSAVSQVYTEFDPKEAGIGREADAVRIDKVARTLNAVGVDASFHLPERTSSNAEDDAIATEPPNAKGRGDDFRFVPSESSVKKEVTPIQKAQKAEIQTISEPSEGTKRVELMYEQRPVDLIETDSPALTDQEATEPGLPNAPELEDAETPVVLKGSRGQEVRVHLKTEDAPPQHYGLDDEASGGARPVSPSSHTAPMAHSRTAVDHEPRALAREHHDLVRSTILETIQHLVADKGRGRTVVRLHPEELGTVTVEVKTYGQGVEAKVTASDERVRTALSHQRIELAQVIESRGLRLDGFSVGREAPHGFGHGSDRANDQPTRHDFLRAAQLNDATNDRAQGRSTTLIRNGGIDTIA